MSVYSWWAYSLDCVLYGSVPLTSKGQENRGREGKERRGGQSFCVSGPESSFSNEAYSQQRKAALFHNQVCLLMCVHEEVSPLQKKKNQQKNKTLKINTQFFKTSSVSVISFIEADLIHSIQCKCSLRRPWNFHWKAVFELSLKSFR